MANIRVTKDLWVRMLGFALLVSLALPAFGQNPIPDENLIAFAPAAVQPIIAVKPFLPKTPTAHKFWDRENRMLFATTAALCAADFSVTHMNLSNGGSELNPLVRPFTANNATLASNFVAQTAGIVAISYLFHRTGHHRFERLAPVANIAASAFAVGYGLSHR